ncbi:hypothetical protein C6501_06970 [Candidatus Poribacteria bacterium]|nr:MAG: hypothetical protein C6501_06970 [Candidatus Poribacteria bacterium]
MLVDLLTLGLCVTFLRLRIAQTLYSVSSKQKTNSQNIKQVFRQINGTHGDKLLESNNIVQTLVIKNIIPYIAKLI